MPARHPQTARPPQAHRVGTFRKSSMPCHTPFRGEAHGRGIHYIGTVDRGV